MNFQTTSKIFVLLGAVFLLTSCTHFASDKFLNNYCRNRDDERPWVRLTSPPEQASELKKLAHRDHSYYRHSVSRIDLWFSLPTGEFKLCRTGPRFEQRCQTEITEFQEAENGWRALEGDVIICVG